jgi:hypothetical protein
VSRGKRKDEEESAHERPDNPRKCNAAIVAVGLAGGDDDGVKVIVAKLAGLPLVGLGAEAKDGT